MRAEADKKKLAYPWLIGNQSYDVISIYKEVSSLIHINVFRKSSFFYFSDQKINPDLLSFFEYRKYYNRGMARSYV
eukprot:c38161_g1_i1 orf=19-246(-)